MKKANTKTRLEEIMQLRNLKQVDILKLAEPYCQKYDVKLNKSDLSQYLAGKTSPNQDKLVILAMALNVSEAWLMGYDVSMNREINDNDTLKDVRMASYNGVDVNGLSDKEIEEIKQFVEFVRNKNKK